MIHSIRSISIASVVALGLLCTPASAQPNGDKAAAEAVFREGRDLMDKGAFKDACPKFEQSLALYQSASAALNLARCYGKTDRLAAALTTLERAVELNRRMEEGPRRTELEELAKLAKKEIEPRVPRVRVVVKPEVSGTVVERNGIQLPAPLVGSALPVDPGTYEIRVSAPGYGDVSKSQTVAEGQTVLVEVTLTRTTETARETLPAPPVAAPTVKDATAPVVWPWAVGATGIALLGVGVGFGVDYALARSDLDALCPNGSCPSGSAKEAESITARWDRDLVLLATGAGAGAALLVTAGVGLYLESRASQGSAPRAQAITVVPWLSPDVTGLAASGSF